jgi:hypothetical protein
MATLVYKMTHDGDPDRRGCWGVQDCMGQVRDLELDAVIGIGGLCWYPRATSRAGEVVWIGIGPRKTRVPRKRGPEVTFDHFLLFGDDAPLLSALAPNLALTMYRTNKRGRWILHGFRQVEEREIDQILDLARDAGPSPAHLAIQPTVAQEDAEERRLSVCRPRRRCPVK